jgi:hypothetical protein
VAPAPGPALQGPRRGSEPRCDSARWRAGRRWLSEVRWPRPDLAEFHLKLIAAAQGGLADPITILDAQRHELLRRLRDTGRAVMEQQKGSDAELLLQGIVLRLQADLRWLETCEITWTKRRNRQ